MEDEDDQDIYDDGTSITNVTAVGRIKSMFEPAMQGPKPSLPSKPSKPTPPKRTEDTKLTQNGDISVTPKNNVNVRRNIGENRDENSNLKNGDIQLNSELVSKFKKFQGSFSNEDKQSSKPPWVKDVNAKPEVNRKPIGKLPIEGFASRVKMFDNKENTSEKADNAKPVLAEKLPGITDKKNAISEKFQPKIPIASHQENRPPLSAVKKPPPTPVKPDTTDPDKKVSPFKPKFPTGPSPISPGGGPQDELLRKIKLRKISVDQSTEESAQTPMRPQKRTQSVKRKSLTRLVDDKKFYLVEIHGISDTPPFKPQKLSDVDLHKIVSEFKKKFSTPNEEISIPQGVFEEEELYEELPADGDDFPPPPPPSDVVMRPVSNRAVSMVEPMTADEEGIQDDVYDDGCSAPADEPVPTVPQRNPPRRGNLPELPPLPKEENPSPVPSKVSEPSDIKEEDDDDDGELYEPLDDVINEVAKMAEEKNSITEEKTEQLSEKERKKREKEEKKRQEEERKKQDEEKKKREKKLKEIKKNFKLEPSDLEPDNYKGNGVIKEDAKGNKKLDLTVKKDQRVFILCMDGSKVPKGKWVAKLEDDEDVIGFVDSNNVEVDNTLIRSLMTGGLMKKSSSNDIIIDDQEEYADVEPEQDEVYSEAM